MQISDCADVYLAAAIIVQCQSTHTILQGTRLIEPYLDLCFILQKLRLKILLSHLMVNHHLRILLLF